MRAWYVWLQYQCDLDPIAASEFTVLVGPDDEWPPTRLERVDAQGRRRRLELHGFGPERASYQEGWMWYEHPPAPDLLDTPAPGTYAWAKDAADG
jgi:hypothetical protein